MSNVARIESLDHDECVRRLATVTTGRIVTCQRALPVVQPVRFALVSGHVAFSLPPGSPLWKAATGQVIAFQADDAAGDHDPSWSVLVQGVCREVRTNIQAEQLWDLPLPRWHTSGTKDHLMVLPIDRLSGERIDWGRPSLFPARAVHGSTVAPHSLERSLVLLQDVEQLRRLTVRQRDDQISVRTDMAQEILWSDPPGDVAAHR